MLLGQIYAPSLKSRRKASGLLLIILISYFHKVKIEQLFKSFQGDFVSQLPAMFEIGMRPDSAGLLAEKGNAPGLTVNGYSINILG